MTFRKSIVIASLALGALAMPAAVDATPISYNVLDLVTGVPGMSGTITTDGTLGVLSVANIIGWSLTIFDEYNTSTLSSGGDPVTVSGEQATATNGSFVVLQGARLSATATQLLFDFSYSSSTTPYYDLYFGLNGPLGGELCYTAGSNCWGPTGAGVYSVGADNLSRYTYYSGSQVIANDGTVVTDASVPEPASLLLVGTGLAVAVRGLRRKRA